jgi:HAD superfamily hydrolase (TIGR01484 family)
MDTKPKAVIFDMDGTLTESKTPITPEMGALVAKLAEQRVVAVMSGGGFPQYEKQFLAGLPGDIPPGRLYLFPTSAAQCRRYEGGSWKSAYDHVFSEDEKARIRAAVAEALEEVRPAKPERTWGETLQDRGAQMSLTPQGQDVPLAEKKEWNRLHDDDRRRMHAALVKKLPDVSVSMGGLTTIDMTRKGINKAYGVRQLSDMTGIPISEMLYVGDALYAGGNDAVVKETGVMTRAVEGPAETARVIKDIIGV